MGERFIVVAVVVVVADVSAAVVSYVVIAIVAAVVAVYIYKPSPMSPLQDEGERGREEEGRGCSTEGSDLPAVYAAEGRG